MSTKTVIVFCVQAFFTQIVFSQQCTSHVAIDTSRFSHPNTMTRFSQVHPSVINEHLAAPINGWTVRGLPNEGFYSPAMEFATTNGGGLPVRSISSISPTGITVISDNAYEGPVVVTGELPLVSAVAVDGNLPTAGVGAIEYGCGNGLVAILSKGPELKTSSKRPGAFSTGPNVAFGSGSNFGSGLALGLGDGFGLAAGSGRSADFANANRISCGGCGCGMFY
ncbi:hypothetical protein PYW08_011333 [Mythimna loreyi]|uniref:Uncharacterized protein n=1 Tax=Mythimna loreyi TaxID=667449 RepID=A0ACC2Q5F6_9NEOP|nr:hypothetical protein PYW08_011333 [Mythimna loreyi]